MNLNVSLKVFISYKNAPHVFQTLWSSPGDKYVGLPQPLSFYKFKKKKKFKNARGI